MKSTGVLFLLGIGMAAANPAAALDIVVGPDGAVTNSPAPVSVASPDIPWEPRWTSDAEAPDTDAADTAAAGGAPTPIVPAAYSDVAGRPTTFR